MTWKDIKGFEGLYQLSDSGEVRSLDRVDSAGRKRKGKVLTIREDGRVRLSRDGKETAIKVSELQTNEPNNGTSGNKKGERTICLPPLVSTSQPATVKENIPIGELLGKHTTEQERLFQVYVPVMLTNIAIAYGYAFRVGVAQNRLPYKKEIRTIREAFRDYEIDMRFALGNVLYSDLCERSRELRQDVDADITRMLYCIDNAVMKAGPELKYHYLISLAEVASVFIHLCWAYDEEFEARITERSGVPYKCGRNVHLVRIDEALREVVRGMCDADKLEGTINLNDFPVLKDCVKAVRNKLNNLAFTFR